VEKRFVNPEFCYLGTLLAAAEQIRSGVTCFADMYYFEEDVAWAAAQAGMRAICGETLMKFPSPDADSYDDSLAYCREFLEHFRDHELIVAAPAPHSVYMTTPELLAEVVRISQEFDVPLVTHVSETKLEVTEWLKAYNMPPVVWMEEQGVLEAKVIAAHCVHVNEREIGILAKRGVGVAHNPTSNLKLASGIAPVAQMLAAGVNVGIGTDGCASNNNLDMFEEIHLSALLPKVQMKNPVAVPASEAMTMATIMGAKALHMDHLIGSIEPGKRADLTVVEMNNAHMVPRFNTTGQNVYSQLVYAARSNDVVHVIINGKVVLRYRKLLTIDEDAVLEEARQLGQRINRFFVKRETNLLDKLVAIGGLKQQETFEIQVKGRVPSVETVQDGLKNPDIRIVRQTVRDQYDNYFLFDESSLGRIRYREDAVLTQDGTESPIYTLTLTEPAKEAVYDDCVVLTRQPALLSRVLPGLQREGDREAPAALEDSLQGDGLRHQRGQGHPAGAGELLRRNQEPHMVQRGCLAQGQPTQRAAEDHRCLHRRSDPARVRGSGVAISNQLSDEQGLPTAAPVGRPRWTLGQETFANRQSSLGKVSQPPPPLDARSGDLREQRES